MFPIAKDKLSFREISDYWSREIPASQIELRRALEGAWWLGEIRGNSAISRLQLLQGMFRTMHGRDDREILFIRGSDEELPVATELPDGSVVIDTRLRIAVPTDDIGCWDEPSCKVAFQALAQTSSKESYPRFEPVFALVELTYKEFDNWRKVRGYHKTTFWQPLSASHRLAKPKRGRPAEYNWDAVKPA